MFSIDSTAFFIFALLVNTACPVFLATNMDTSSTTGLPYFDKVTQKRFHENGFHGEIEGFAAKHEQECGTVFLDYGSYIDGRMFDEVLKMFKETLDDNNTLDRDLRAKVYTTLKQQALKPHIQEIREIFENYRSTTPHYNSEQLEFFPVIGVIAFGVGIGLGKFVYDSVSSLLHRFREEEQQQSKLAENLLALRTKLHNLAEIVELQTTVNRFNFVFSHVRTQLSLAVESALTELFDRGSVSNRLIKHRGENNLLSAIEKLMGEKRFNMSMLKKRYFAAGQSLKATVLSMNKHVMVVKICYPTTREEDLGYLMRVVALGKFSEDGAVYATPRLGTYYIVPMSMKVSNVGMLAEIGDVDVDCTGISSTLLCKTRPQKDSCALDRNKRHGCGVLKRNSSDEMFTHVEPLLRTTVIATRRKRMLYRKSDESKWIEVAVLQPVTVVEVPKGALLQLGPIEVTARVATRNMSLELNIIIPSSNSSLEPYVESYDGYVPKFYDYKEYYAWNFCIDRILGSLMFGLLSLIIFNQQRQLRSLRRWTRSIESLRKAQREPIEIVPIRFQTHNE